MDFFEVEWTPEKIACFWSAYEETPGMQNWHFSKQRGAALLSWTSKKASICAPVLDLGCGSGHLTSLLLARGIQTYGADVSDNAEKIVTGRFKGDYNFLGFKQIEAGKSLPFENNSIKTIFLLETVEHLLQPVLDNLLLECRRILASGGHIIVTTPNQENLKDSFVFCRNCGAQFHSFQHVRSLNSSSLWDFLEKAGFKKVICRSAVLFPDWSVWLVAQKCRRVSWIPCPECGYHVPNTSISSGNRIRSIIRELYHLVCIAST